MFHPFVTKCCYYGLITIEINLLVKKNCCHWHKLIYIDGLTDGHVDYNRVSADSRQGSTREGVIILKISSQTCFHTLNPYLFARIDGH